VRLEQFRLFVGKAFSKFANLKQYNVTYINVIVVYKTLDEKNFNVHNNRYKPYAVL